MGGDYHLAYVPGLTPQFFLIFLGHFVGCCVPFKSAGFVRLSSAISHQVELGRPK
jgi:hypothetical protein